MARMPVELGKVREYALATGAAAVERRGTQIDGVRAETEGRGHGVADPQPGAERREPVIRSDAFGAPVVPDE
jgi:hypothetical protein